MDRGFFGSLFDLSFTSFVTTRLIRVLYILSLVLLGLGYLAFVGAAFSDSVGAGLLVLIIVGPLFLFFYTLLYRVFFELIIVLFRIFENTRDQLAATRAMLPGATPPPAPVAPAGGQPPLGPA